MTIRKLWLIVLVLVAVISVTINAIILSVLTDKYFNNIQAENYEKHFNQIVDYASKALLEEDLSLNQMAIELETHLDDPITRIKLYDDTGDILVDVGVDSHTMSNMHMSGMMSTMMQETSQAVDNVQLVENGKVVGQLNITRYSAIENSIVSQQFKASLIFNSFYAIVIVLVISILIGIVISKRMSRDLMSTARIAQNISLGENTNLAETKIREIRMIQQSLETLQNRLKLKNKSRKVLVDELVHQTRTPLTILKTHLEGFSDGIIDMTPEEVGICENQIENLTVIISNMSGMIDAEKDFDTLKVDTFELSAMLSQIVNGLKVQFDKKHIDLQLNLKEKVLLNTDKYKLSQAVYSVLTNAYKYTKEKGYVKIDYSCDLNAGQTTIQIEDNGRGIKGEDLEKIFDAYYRSNVVSAIDGEGLGLYLAKESLKRIDGDIKVRSEENVGSKFTIMIENNIEAKKNK